MATKTFELQNIVSVAIHDVTGIVTFIIRDRDDVYRMSNGIKKFYHFCLLERKQKIIGIVIMDITITNIPYGVKKKRQIENKRNKTAKILRILAFIPLLYHKRKEMSRSEYTYPLLYLFITTDTYRCRAMNHFPDIGKMVFVLVV